ncbi:MAG: tetratricopeptide repeat protein [Bdellovibrionales bacterium]|nr:tetratricopeptide repeat protein [Bdellovibrionales bacterium]
MEQAQARLLLDPIPPTKFAPTLGRRWEKAILRCLRREPTQRFQRGQDFIRALDPPLRRNTRLAALVAALLTGAIAWGVSVRRGADSATEDPLIVVPFARTGNAEAWQAEALTDDLAAEFAGIPGMHVIASSTAKRLRDIGTVPADLRRQFRIGTVLSGSIDGAAGRLRIGVQLVDARTGYLMWSHTYEGVGENLPHVEETIVLASVRAMHLNVAPPQVSQIRNRHSEVFAAYRAYSLGQYWMNRRNTQGLQEAIRNFKEAVREDPNYALAFAQLGAAYNLIASRGVMPREDAFRQSNSALTKALALAPDLPEALLIKGSNLQIDNWDWDQAERCFRRSLELAPGLSTAHHWLAGLLSARGRHDEAIAEITQARDIDPLSAPVASSYGALLFRAGRVDEAQRQLEWVVKREPAFLNAKLLLADVESYVGQHQKAIELLQAAVAVEGRATYILGDLGHHLASAGRVDEARAIIRELEARFEGGEGRPSEIAEIYHGLGDSDQACAWLERGIPLRDAGVTVLKVDPTWQSLREFPRFRSLVERLKL